MDLHTDFFYLRSLLHYFLHFALPVIISYAFYGRTKALFIKSALILLAANFIDLDHLLATPVFDAHRCSIGFHPLHSYIATGVYGAMLLFPKTRILAVGLLMHIAVDFMDCILM